MLSREEQEQLELWLNTTKVGIEAVERPVVPSVRALDEKATVVMGGEARLSKTTLKRQEKKLAYEARIAKGKANRAKAAVRGRFHYKSKQATQRRRAAERWRDNPYGCMVYGYGVWSITREEWDEHLSDYWKLYDSKHLTIKRKWGHGTHKSPYKLWHLQLYYKGKLLWDGWRQQVYILSKPNALDIEKAPEGADLFTEEYSYKITQYEARWKGMKGVFIPY